MSIPGSSAPLLLAQQPEEGPYTIERSVRFNSSDSAYLSRTPSTAGNRKTWTWAGWAKRSELSLEQVLWTAGNDPNSGAWSSFRFYPSTGQLQFVNNTNGSNNINLLTTQVFRDTGAWYHILLRCDILNATSGDRVDIYVNGEKISAYSAETQPGTTVETGINAAQIHNIGREAARSTYYCDLYLADIHFIDGQALDPTSFGEFDTNGIWQPIKYTGSYGTNGFHLDFADNSTAAALGTDTSGAGNNWTVNNISVANAVSYSSSASVTSGSINRTPANIFDGVALNSTNPSATGNSGVWSTSSFTIAYSPGIPFSSQLDINAVISGNGGIDGTGSAIDIQLSGGSFFSIKSSKITGSNSYDAIYRYVGSGTLTGVRISPTSGFSAILNTHYSNSIPLIDNFSGPDSLVDVPTNGTETDTGVGGEVRGNYCTLNPLFGDAVAIKNGNLDYDGTVDASLTGTRATFSVGSGKWYYEVTLNSPRGFAAGWTASSNQDASPSARYGITCRAFNNDYRIVADATFYDPGDTGSANDVIGVAFDADQEKAWFAINGVWKGSTSQDPATDTGGYTGSTMTGPYTPYFVRDSRTYNSEGSANFGQRPFAYTAPSGFKALCTANLDAPVVTKPSEYMDILLWTGDGSASRSISLPISGDLVWAKKRSATNSHQIADTVRGDNAVLLPNATNAESDPVTDFVGGGISSITATEFVISQGTSDNNNLNLLNGTHVAWTWDAGGSTVTNTDGSISSQVRANPSAGFSIVTYSVGASGSTVGHGLGVAPGLIIAKSRTDASSWAVYHASLGASNPLSLPSTAAAVSLTNYWGTPNSTTFGLYNTGTANNRGDMVAYCFAPVDGYSSFGSYTGNGSADGPFVFCGFRPRYLLFKSSSAVTNWVIQDTARFTYNEVEAGLLANRSDGEFSSGYDVDILSNGFKLRRSGGDTNASGATYIYAAFAEFPMALNARAR